MVLPWHKHSHCQCPTLSDVHTTTLSLTARGLRERVVSSCFLERPFFFKPIFFSETFFFFWILGWGQATLRHFLPRVYIWLQPKEREIGKGSRTKRWWHRVKISEHQFSQAKRGK